MTAVDILDYLTQALTRSGLQLALLLGPLLLCGLAMHGIATLIRSHAARLCGPTPHIWLTIPGVVAHELGHALFCRLFGHKIVAISLFRPGSDGVLGYVKHSWERNSLWQNVGNFFIGTGPLWSGSALIVLLLALLPGPSLLPPLAGAFKGFDPASPPGVWLAALGAELPQLLDELFVVERLSNGSFWLILYLIFAIASHLCLSPADLKGALAGLCAGVLCLFLLNLAALGLGTDPAALLLPLAPYALAPALILLLVLVCNLALALLLFLLSSGRS